MATWKDFIKRHAEEFDLFTEYTEKKTEPLQWLNILYLVIMTTVTIGIFVYYGRLTFPLSETGVYSDLESKGFPSTISSTFLKFGVCTTTRDGRSIETDVDGTVALQNTTSCDPFFKTRVAFPQPFDTGLVLYDIFATPTLVIFDSWAKVYTRKAAIGDVQIDISIGVASTLSFDQCRNIVNGFDCSELYLQYTASDHSCLTCGSNTSFPYKKQCFDADALNAARQRYLVYCGEAAACDYSLLDFLGALDINDFNSHMAEITRKCEEDVRKTYAIVNYVTNHSWLEVISLSMGFIFTVNAGLFFVCKFIASRFRQQTKRKEPVVELNNY